MRVLKTIYSAERISMEKVYYDNVIHICIYEGRKELFSSDITKKMFKEVIPLDFLDQVILSDINFMGIDQNGYHYQAIVSIPESAVYNLIDLTIDFDQKLNITAAK